MGYFLRTFTGQDLLISDLCMKREMISFSKHSILTNVKAFPVRKMLIAFGEDFSATEECLKSCHLLSTKKEPY